MDVTVTYDQAIDAFDVRNIQVKLTTTEELEAWRDIFYRRMEDAFHGKKQWILVEMAGIEIHPTLADQYGAVAKGAREKYAAGVVRWGSFESNSVATMVRLEAVKNRYPANVFQGREKAVEAMHQIRKALLEDAD